MKNGSAERRERERGRGDKDHKIVVINDTVSTPKLEQLIGGLVKMFATTFP